MDRSDLQLIPVPAEIEVTDGRKLHGLPLQSKINEVSNCPTIHADRFMMMVLPASNETRGARREKRSGELMLMFLVFVVFVTFRDDTRK